jgi:hypothetical protein
MKAAGNKNLSQLQRRSFSSRVEQIRRWPEKEGLQMPFIWWEQ